MEQFWALCGGGSLGVVTAVELSLLPISQVHAGILWWPISRGPEVFRAWHQLTMSGPPDELSTLGRYLQVPGPELPEQLRGKSFVLVEAIHLGWPSEADRCWPCCGRWAGDGRDSDHPDAGPRPHAHGP